jgi:hypothetical protein
LTILGNPTLTIWLHQLVQINFLRGASSDPIVSFNFRTDKILVAMKRNEFAVVAWKIKENVRGLDVEINSWIED